MSYVDDKATGSKLTSAVLVLVMISLFGWGFISALQYDSFKAIVEDLNAFDVVEEPPPPPDEPPPPPPPDTPQPAQPPVVTPKSIIQMPPTNNPVPPSPPPTDYTQRPTPPAPAGPAPAPPPPPPPPPPSVAKKAVQRSGSISDADYPPAALRADAEGTTGARYVIGTDGKVSGCTVTKSSGNSALDTTTCNLIERRYKFKPAEDASGNPISETRSVTIRWQLPKD